MSQDTYFYTIDNELPPFAPVPLAILTKNHLSAEAKVIYALILSRTQLSASKKTEEPTPTLTDSFLFTIR